ncbi:MAG: tryptophan synthase subunit alpha [Firmicutes bacterium HGW-Firmicutes-1]|nr:MAG: tryptophan synthase subunit alpha [Firmicutes bacterium HGW-Firmicutes-1]
MNRIDKKFIELKQKNKKAFIGFITAGDPTLEDTAALVHALEEAGTDIIEIGIPYSDPLADGPVIQLANQRAFMNADLSVANIMAKVGFIRKTTEVPLLYLVYINTIIVYGKEKFMKDCVDAGIDGLIIPDMPLEEREELMVLINETDLALIPLVAPTSKDRISKIVDGCKGFVYCVSSLGVTGRSSQFHEGIEAYLKDVKSKTNLPIAVGFGISNKKDINALSDLVDGVIVGSAIVQKVAEGKGDIEIVKNFIKELTVLS